MSTAAPPFVRDRRFAFDLVLCTLVTLLTASTSLVVVGESPSTALGLMITLPLVARRVLPRVAFAVMLVGALATVLLVQEVSAPGLVAVPIMVYTLARWNERPLAQTGLGAALTGSLLGPARWTLSSGTGWSRLSLFAVAVVACVAVVTVAYVLGRRRRESLANARQHAQAQAERTRLVQAEQTQRERVATVDERTRIARELHDIVAHSLSVIVVQAEGGRAAAAKRPEQAAVVLATIAETGREALAETRRILGVLRDGGEPAGGTYVPTPGLADVAELVRRTSDRAELRTFGTPPAVGPALGLTAYRIVQESLTNVLKHAGSLARARVVLACTADAIEIEVSDDGPDAGPGPDGPGHGLRGMAERVALHQGSLTAGPGPSGGWLVRAWLPLDPAALDPTPPRPTSPRPTSSGPTSSGPTSPGPTSPGPTSPGPTTGDPTPSHAGAWTPERLVRR